MTTSPTPEAIAAMLAEANFAEYDPDASDPMGFHVHKAAFGPEIVVELKGIDTLPFNPGEGPRALLDDYAAAIRKAGWPVRTPSGCVIVPPATEPAEAETPQAFAGAPLPDHVTELDEGAYLIEMPDTEVDR